MLIKKQGSRIGMGVQIYLLDRRNVTLVVDDRSVQIGILRRSWKVTETDDARAAEIDAAKASLAGREAPSGPPSIGIAEFRSTPPRGGRRSSGRRPHLR